LIPLSFFTKGTGVTLLEIQKLSSVFQNDLSAVDALLMVIICGVLVTALVADLAWLIGWLRKSANVCRFEIPKRFGIRNPQRVGDLESRLIGYLRRSLKH
jgi:hypothetical protein